MKTIISSLFFFTFTFYNVNAQKPPIRWGKISNIEKTIEICEFDSTAEAVILCDYGNINFTGRNILIEHHKRIKILNDNAKDHGNIVLHYYHKDGLEDIRKVRAQTLLFKDGKLEKIPIGKNDIFDVKVDEKWSEIRFSFPLVQKGAILEYSYHTVSESYTNLESWAFQSDLPTLHSEISATIREGLDYKIFYQGWRLINKYSERTRNSWSLTNLPAVKDEDFCPNPMDYIEQVNFQLVGYNYQGGYEKVLASWEQLAKDVIKHTDYRGILSKKQLANKIVESIIETDDKPHEKLKKIYNYIVQNYTWEQEFGILPNQNLKQIIEKKSGSGADLNVFLVHLLQTAGLDANPVLISTKKHGIVSKSYPLISQFNHTIAQVRLNGKDILMDATSSLRPYNLLAKRDLNKEGYLLNDKNPRWISIPINQKSQIIQLVKMDITNPQAVKYKLDISAKNYEALALRKDIRSESEFKAYLVKQFLKEHSNLIIDSLYTKNLAVVEKPVSFTAYITDYSICTINDDYLYISPFVNRVMTKNPFEIKPRYLPVDFYHPKSEKYILNMAVPDEYEVLEIPENLSVKLPGNKAVLKLSSSHRENNVQLVMELSILDPLIPGQEYFQLVELFDLYFSKREEQIVLKRKDR